MYRSCIGRFAMYRTQHCLYRSWYAPKSSTLCPKTVMYQYGPYCMKACWFGKFLLLHCHLHDLLLLQNPQWFDVLVSIYWIHWRPPVLHWWFKWTQAMPYTAHSPNWQLMYTCFWSQLFRNMRLETINYIAVDATISKWVPFVNNSVTEYKLSNVKPTPFEKFLPALRSKRVYAAATWLDGWVDMWVSVTRRYCIKMAKPILKLFRPSGSHTILVSSDPCADTKFQREPLQ